MFSRFNICCGVVIVVLFPSPSSPFMFEPHPYTFPSSIIAMLWLSPTPMATTVPMFSIFVAFNILLVWLSIPPSPFSFVPIAYISPVLFWIIAWFFPAFMSIAFVIPFTSFIPVLLAVLPIPPSPFPFCPQLYICPSFPITYDVLLPHSMSFMFVNPITLVGISMFSSVVSIPNCL